jgi:hypothetical protein
MAKKDKKKRIKKSLGKKAISPNTDSKYADIDKPWKKAIDEVVEKYRSIASEPASSFLKAHKIPSFYCDGNFAGTSIDSDPEIYDGCNNLTFEDLFLIFRKEFDDLDSYKEFDAQELLNRIMRIGNIAEELGLNLKQQIHAFNSHSGQSTK